MEFFKIICSNTTLGSVSNLLCLLWVKPSPYCVSLMSAMVSSDYKCHVRYMFILVQVLASVLTHFLSLVVFVKHFWDQTRQSGTSRRQGKSPFSPTI